METFSFLDVNGTMSVQEAEKAKSRLMKDMPLTFHGALAYIMKGRTTVDELVERIPISRRTLLRLRTEERKSYSIDQIVAICVGLHTKCCISIIKHVQGGMAQLGKTLILFKKSSDDPVNIAKNSKLSRLELTE